MILKNGYFYHPDGTRYIPLGQFGGYFCADYIDEEVKTDSHNSNSMLEFQKMPRGIWRRFFRYLSEEVGATAIRLFPRGDSNGAAWEGLDIGGRVNLDLLEKMKWYLRDARDYGIKLQLCLFTEPECSFYCQKYTRLYWGRRMWTDDEVKNASPEQRRFLENTDDIISYEDFFTDPDVRKCCHRFLDEILPLLRDFEDLFAIEIFNEMGWASPHAVPMNTFRWEATPGYIDWMRDMAEHIKRDAPDLPLMISDPGVGLLGHDTVHWGRESGVDFFSLHNYPDICGYRPGADYAAITDMTLQYTKSVIPAMMGEWEVFRFRHLKKEDANYHTAELLSRDTAWLTMLSGAPGCVSWCASGFGQYHAIREVFSLLDEYPLIPSPTLVIDIAEAQQWFEALWHDGREECEYPDHLWCPDKAATDGKHRFCVKAKSGCCGKLLDAERWSLEFGVPFRFALGEGIPLMDITRDTFAEVKPYLAPVVGYQQKAFSADNDSVRIVFLRNFNIEPSIKKKLDGSEFCEYELRVQKKVPVVLKGMDPDYRVRLYDLETREIAEIDPRTETGLGVTDHDFVLIMEKK